MLSKNLFLKHDRKPREAGVDLAPKERAASSPLSGRRWVPASLS
jgi:hypothetical protein